MRQIAQFLPNLPEPDPAAAAGQAEARRPWPCRSDSTTRPVRFVPISKEEKLRRWRKAERLDETSHQKGRHGGALGRVALNVLRVLLFRFLNTTTGRLDPSVAAIAEAAHCSQRAAFAALKKLRGLGLIHWQRRAEAATDSRGGFLLRQITNAYAILAPAYWRIGREPPPEPPPDPASCGAHPPPLDPAAEAEAALAAGEPRAALAVLGDLGLQPAPLDIEANRAALLRRAIRWALASRRQKLSDSRDCSNRRGTPAESEKLRQRGLDARCGA